MSNAYSFGVAIAHAHAIERLQKVRELRLRGEWLTRTLLFATLFDKDDPCDSAEVNAFFQAVGVESDGADRAVFVDGLLDELAKRERERRPSA